jgi:hypothetical protein
MLEGEAVVTIGRLNNQYKALAEVAGAGMGHLEVAVCLPSLEQKTWAVAVAVKQVITLATLVVLVDRA